MKKILLISILIGLLILPTIGLTQSRPTTTTDIKKVPQDVHPLKVLERIVDVVFTILLIFAALMIVVAGFYFITASGDTEKVKTARNFVLYALIGVIVAFLARGLIWFIDNVIIRM